MTWKISKNQLIVRFSKLEKKRLGLPKGGSLINMAIDIAIARGDRPDLQSKNAARHYLGTLAGNALLNPAPGQIRSAKISALMRKAGGGFSTKAGPRASDAFLESFEWRKLRMEVLKKYGARCMCCNATREDGVKLHVDHIKPRRDYPDLALEFDNLQILCEVCNHGKGNWDQTDWRPEQKEILPDGAAEHMESLTGRIH